MNTYDTDAKGIGSAYTFADLVASVQAKRRSGCAIDRAIEETVEMYADLPRLATINLNRHFGRTERVAPVRGTYRTVHTTA